MVYVPMGWFHATINLGTVIGAGSQDHSYIPDNQTAMDYVTRNPGAAFAHFLTGYSANSSLYHSQMAYSIQPGNVQYCDLAANMALKAGLHRKVCLTLTLNPLLMLILIRGCGCTHGFQGIPPPKVFVLVGNCQF